MATKLECLIVTCPRCGDEYSTWQGIGLEDLGPDPCPRCGFTPNEDPRLFQDGPVEPLDEDEVRLQG